MSAYAVKEYQIVGPGWLDATDETTRFVIDATMPAGTTKDQLRVILQNLLAERFKLGVHRVERARAKYSLVLAKNGPKMKELAEAAASNDDGSLPPGARSTGQTDAYGFPNWKMPLQGGTWRFVMNGRGRIGGERATMQDLANELSAWQLKSPVTDETGLKAKYDFVLTYSMPDRRAPSGDSSEPMESLPDVFGALQSQLGLRLEPNRGPVDVIRDRSRREEAYRELGMAVRKSSAIKS
jgi:uncharacterized protein (TIGR03435 family)